VEISLSGKNFLKHQIPNPGCSGKHFAIKIQKFLKKKSAQRKLFFVLWNCYFYVTSCSGKQETVPIKKSPDFSELLKPI